MNEESKKKNCCLHDFSYFLLVNGSNPFLITSLSLPNTFGDVFLTISEFNGFIEHGYVFTK